MDLTNTRKLANNIEVPLLGFGTWQMTPEQTEQAVTAALEVGYRLIDTAAAYGNESAVGHAIKSSSLMRSEIFLTTKLDQTALDYKSAKAAIDQSLTNLNCDYIDLLLIHWPNPLATRPHFQARNAAVWKAMEEALQAGKVRALGTANFQIHHLEALLDSTYVQPVVNQIYCNPSDQQEKIVAYNQAHNLLTEAYSPLGTGQIFKILALKDLAEKYNKTTAQIVLRWHLQKGYLPLPKSITPKRIKENIQLFDFELTAKDLNFIDSLHGSLLPYKYPDSVQF